MNPTEKAWGIVIVALTALGMAVRVQSSQVADPPTPVVRKTVELPTGPIPVSAPPPTPVPHTRVAGTFQTYAEPTRPAQVQLPEEPQVDEPDPATGYVDEQQLTDPDAIVNAIGDDQAVDPNSASDQQLMDMSIEIMNPEQRVAFQDIWSRMTAAERREWLAQLRMTMAR